MLSSRFSCCHTMFMYTVQVYNQFLMKDFFYLSKKHVFRCQSIKLGYFCLYKFTMNDEFVQMLNWSDTIMSSVFLHSYLKHKFCFFVSVWPHFVILVAVFVKKKAMWFSPYHKDTYVHHLLLPWALYLLLYLWYMILFDYGRCSNWVGG